MGKPRRRRLLWRSHSAPQLTTTVPISFVKLAAVDIVVIAQAENEEWRLLERPQYAHLKGGKRSSSLNDLYTNVKIRKLSAGNFQSVVPAAGAEYSPLPQYSLEISPNLSELGFHVCQNAEDWNTPRVQEEEDYYSEYFAGQGRKGSVSA